MRYTIRFVGCLKGAIGIHYPIDAEAEGDTEAAALLKLYDTYDHVQRPAVVAEDGQLVPLRRIER